MIRLTIAFLASIVTLTQCLLIYFNGDGICLNDGCEIVESLTTIPPLVFNLAGLLFFQTVFWALFFARNGSEIWIRISKLVLLAALGAEGVLIFFQWQIAATFCSYCLIVFSCILLLNVLYGLRQIATGGMIFIAVVIACFSLQWNNNGLATSLDNGSIAIVAGEKNSGGGYLFFSQNCQHCEKIIDELRKGNRCDIRFNPIDNIPQFSFPDAELKIRYDIQVNLDFLNILSIKEVPVFLTNDGGETRILQGETQIQEYLKTSCQVRQEVDYSGSTSISPTQNYKQNVRLGSDGCSVIEDCDENIPGTSSTSKANQ